MYEVCLLSVSACLLQIHGLTNLLLEYTTRISSSEEHQQVRIFIEKLKNHRPFTASGVFTVDLGITGPVGCL